MSTTDLDRRIRRLEDLEEIRLLKHRYFRCLDLKLWNELADCFGPDATASYAGGKYRYEGRDAILAFLRGALGRERGATSVHHGHHPEIEITGEATATGTWALYNYMFVEAERRGIRIGAYYEDRYVKLDGSWKIAHTGYVELFHEEWSRDDTPSLRVLGQEP